MKGSEPNLAYRLNAKNLQGQGFATRTLLLDDIARRIEAGEIGRELLTLPDAACRWAPTWIAAPIPTFP